MERRFVLCHPKNCQYNTDRQAHRGQTPSESSGEHFYTRRPIPSREKCERVLKQRFRDGRVLPFWYKEEIFPEMEGREIDRDMKWIEHIIEMLLQGKQPNASLGHFKYTPLFLAANFGKRKVAKFLLKHGANVNARNWAELTPLLVSVKRCHISLAENLIAHGADINTRDLWGISSLRMAILYQYVDFVRLFLQHGAELDSGEDAGGGLFRFALECLSRAEPDGLMAVSTEIIDLLVNCGCSLGGEYGSFVSVHRIVTDYLQDAGAVLELDVRKKLGPRFTREDYAGQFSLRQQCRRAVRRSLAVSRDIATSIPCLPLPGPLMEYLQLSSSLKSRWEASNP